MENNKQDYLAIDFASFSFPQFSIKEKHIKLDTEEEVYKFIIMDLNEKTNFIWNNMTKDEKELTLGKDWLKKALNLGCCGFHYTYKKN